MKIRVLLTSLIMFNLLGLSTAHAFPERTNNAHAHCSGRRCVVLDTTVSSGTWGLSVRGYRYANISWRVECNRSSWVNFVFISVGSAYAKHPSYDDTWSFHKRVDAGHHRLVLRGRSELDAYVAAFGYSAKMKVLPCRLHFRVTGIRPYRTPLLEHEADSGKLQ